MPRKKDTPYDFIKWRCSDLKNCMDKLDKFKANVKKGQIDTKDLTDIKRTTKFCRDNILENLSKIEKIYQKLV